MNILKGDTVLITTGKDRGKKGKVLEVLPGADRIVVEGLNLRAKNVRAKRAGEKGQVVRFNAPFHASNAMVVCGHCNKSTRIGHRIVDGKKHRVCKHCNSQL